MRAFPDFRLAIGPLQLQPGLEKMSQRNLSVAIIGGGPVGLAAAAHLITRNIPVKLYEAGDTIAANVRDWGHVRLFSPWSFNADQAAKAILKQHGWQEPPEQWIADRLRSL